jgi:Rod binding domain-containing protein
MKIPPLTQPASAALPATEVKLRRAAEDFTAVTLNELLKPIFDTVDESDGPFGGGAGERAFQPMLVNEIAKNIAQTGGLGLVEPVYQQMLRLQEGKH